MFGFVYFLSVCLSFFFIINKRKKSTKKKKKNERVDSSIHAHLARSRGLCWSSRISVQVYTLSNQYHCSHSSFYFRIGVCYICFVADCIMAVCSRDSPVLYNPLLFSSLLITSLLFSSPLRLCSHE
eukprot:Rmarinus@m.12277